MGQRRHNRVEVGLAGLPAHGSHRRVGHVDSRVAGLQHAGGVDAAGVVGVEVNGDADFPAQRAHQLFGGIGLAQARHVLDGQDVRAHAFQFLGHAHVVLQRVLVAPRIEDVAGVADGGLAQAAGAAHGLHRDLHVGQPVEGIEDAENVDALRRGLLDKCRHHVVGIRRIAHRVGGAQQHLETDIGDGLAKLAQPREGVLVQEAHHGVEGGAAPHFQTEEIVQAVGDEVGDGQHVVGADARGQQRLVRVAEGGVGDQQALLAQGPLGEFFGTEPCRSWRVPSGGAEESHEPGDRGRSVPIVRSRSVHGRRR